ncbi:hypothetical protein [Mycoavidus sp. B2-EB]|nr:hypothetical protein [Mycoavidus sp. B2-EB]
MALTLSFGGLCGLTELRTVDAKDRSQRLALIALRLYATEI